MGRGGGSRRLSLRVCSLGGARIPSCAGDYYARGGGGTTLLFCMGGGAPHLLEPKRAPPPPLIMQRMLNTKQVTQTQGHMNHKVSQELPVGMHIQLCSETGSVCLVFWREYLTLKSCTCSTGATGMGFPAADLAATWAAGLAALLVEGLARGLAALGAGLAGGLAPAPVASTILAGTILPPEGWKLTTAPAGYVSI